VALIRPDTIVLPKSLSWYGPVPPIGLAYVAAALREAGHAVQVIDAPGEAITTLTEIDSPVGTLQRCGLSVDEIVARIRPGTQLVGITHMFLHEWPHVREIAEAVRARFPDAVIVAGGENATAYWPWMFAETDAIDACVLGEGEATAVAVADHVAAGLPLAGLAGVAARDDGAVVDGGLSERVPSRRLGTIERPAWDLFPMENYFGLADFFGVHRGRAMPVLATRGCPYRCTFCSSPQMWTTRYSVRDPGDVADEIAGYVERYGVRNVNFADLTAITKRSWTLAFCDALEARAPDLIWQLPVGTRAEVLDAEVLQRLWDTGCRNITYAPEAGGQRMLDRYDKRVDLDMILRSLREANRIGIATKVNIIVGHPAERVGDQFRSFLFLMKAAWAGANDAAVMMFGPYPGSADFQELVDSGRLEVDDEYPYTALSWSSGHHESYNPHLGRRRLRLAQMLLLFTFYGAANLLRPLRLWGHLRAFRTGRESTQLDALVRSKRHGYAPVASDERRVA
jgi:radical SAM superfamily enzyme YgiQ (UPF0313 family)